MELSLGQNISENTAAIQSAIDVCSRNGGGTVFVPEGVHVCGSIELKSNVRLHLPRGAALNGSSDFGDYPCRP